jgi:hypothetical protein
MPLSDIPRSVLAESRQRWYAALGHTPKLGQRLMDEAVDAGKRNVGLFTPPQDGKSYHVAKHVGCTMLFPDVHGWIVAPCVDVETEILTQRGWLTVEMVRSSDTALTINGEGFAEWQSVESIHIYPWDGEMVEMNFRGHDSLTTPHHRWLVGWTGSSGEKGNGPRRDRGYRFVTSETLGSPNEFIPCAAPVVNLPVMPTHTDAFVELIAWYWTEGHENTCGDGLAISQNEGPGADRIAASLRGWLGPPRDSLLSAKDRCEPAWRDWIYRSAGPTGLRCGDFGLNGPAGNAVKSVAPDKVVSPQFLVSLTKAQLELFIAVSVMADGHERKRTTPRGREVRERAVLQSRSDRLSSLQMACQLAGYQTTMCPDPQHGYRLSIYERNRIWPGAQKHRYAGVKRIQHQGVVWCPKTPNGTWLARRNGTVYFTGNTYQDGAKEFGYLAQDFAAMGMRKGARRWHWDIRGGNMHIEFKNGSWVQVISAENPENLRREQLDWVILAEASKLPSNLRDRYLYARIEKRQGITYVPTTHKGYGWVWDSFAVPSTPFKPKTGEWTPWKDGRRERINGDPNPAYDPDYWSCQVSYVPEFGDVLHAGEYLPEVIEKARKRLPRPMFAEQFGGEAASYSGLVYPFDPMLHECDPFEAPRDWTHIVGWDHGAGGGSDPTAIAIGSYSPNGTLYWWNEIYDVTTASIAQRGGWLKLKLNGRQPSAIMTGRDAMQVITELLTVDLIAGTPHDWSVNARIIRMTELLQTGKMKLMRGRVPNLRREILDYEWDEKAPGKPKDGNDHCLEGAGYASLAPVGLPEESANPTPELTPEQRAEKERIDFLWADLLRERKEREDREDGNRLSDVFDPNPLEMVESWTP